MDPAGANAGAGVAAAAAARPGRSMFSVRLEVASAIFVMGCAAAALAFFAMALNPASSHFMGPCAPTDAEATDLRNVSGVLLVAAAAQVLGATVARLMPVPPCTIFACVLGVPTGYQAAVVLRMIVACHGHAHGELGIYYWIFIVVLCAALLVAAVGAIVSSHG